MRIVRTMMATCVYLGLATGAAMAQKAAGSGAASGAPKAPAADKTPAAPAMEMPKVPQEVIDLSKKMAGTWKCEGKVHNPMDGSTRDTTGNLQFSVDLDKFWLKSSLTETKTKTPFKFESFVTYDPASKKWAEVSIDNIGGYRVLTSDGMKDKVITWTGQGTAMGHTVQVKAVHTVVSDKNVKIDESISSDSGKTWMPSVEVECKK